MPPAEHILNGLREVANAWKIVSILWHVYFGAFLVMLALGICPPRRLAALLLGLPFLSVGAFGWLSFNPVNGAVFTIFGLTLLLLAAKLKGASIQIAPLWSMIPGVLFVAFGWIYPHFLDTASYLPYLYAAPVGIIPCPTLILAIGFMLILDNLGSRRLGMALGLVGLLYGILGVTYLRIALDWILILGACLILIYPFVKKRNPASRKLMAGA